MLAGVMVPVIQPEIRIGVRIPRVRMHTLFARRGKVGGRPRIDRL
jgi:hypothetical protein